MEFVLEGQQKGHRGQDFPLRLPPSITTRSLTTFGCGGSLK